MSMHPPSSNGMQYSGSFQQSHSSLQQHTPYAYPPQVQAYNSNYYRAQTSQQGTLSPQVLHQPSGISPAMFYGHHQQQEQLKKEQEERDKKEAMQKSIRSMLTTFSGAAAVGRLVALIDDYGMAEVEPHLRIELLTRMRDNAGNHYFRAWAENDLAIEVTREWLKAAAKGDRAELADTIMPLLHIIDRLPFTLESLSASKLGKVVRYINSKENSFPPAIKDMASNLEKRWRQMLASAPETKGTLESAEDGKSKKRKLGEGAKSTGTTPSGGTAGGPPAKKPAVGTASSAKPTVAKKEAPSSKTATTATAAATRDTKTDMSFFSAPKTKKALPSFKKAPVAAPTFKKEENVAQPSAVDPFQELLKSMNKPKKESPVIRTPPAATNTPPGGVETASGVPGIGKNGKPKKSVTWAPEGKLEAIRLIEPAVYDDDPAHGTRMTNFRDLDKGEGAALHTAIFEEILDWSEPQVLELDESSDRPRGENSQEASTQAEREQTALSALYMSTAQIPESPAEPSTAALTEEEVDQNVAHMTVGEDNDHMFWGEEMEYAAQQQSSAAAVAAAVAAGFPNPAGSANPAGNVALLIQQLAQGVNPLGAVLSNDMQQQQTSVPALPNSDQLAQLLSQLAGAGAGSGITMQPQYGQASYGDDQSNPAGGWTATSNQFSADYGQGYDDPEHSRGWDGENHAFSLQKEGEHLSLL
ncbi:hypothetical protein BKA70DRAFT_1369172 [Coprinopsis sp. MPI-PUGE-AT-0042]|nr:hypothetical protein BKA70DRAFT_1369172 [Coprinopsis sp. MPI-PUGE-AT-0042]